MSDMMQKIVNFQLVEIPLTNFAAANTINFPDIPNLRDTAITGIEVYSTDQVVSAPSGAAAIVPGPGDLANFTINLENHGGKVFVLDLPAVALAPYSVAAGGQPNMPHSFTGQRLNWPKCFFRYLGGLGAARTLVVGVYYLPTPGSRDDNSRHFNDQA